MHVPLDLGCANTACSFTPGNRSPDMSQTPDHTWLKSVITVQAGSLWVCLKIQYENYIQGQLSIYSWHLSSCPGEPSNSTSLKWPLSEQNKTAGVTYGENVSTSYMIYHSHWIHYFPYSHSVILHWPQCPPPLQTYWWLPPMECWTTENSRATNAAYWPKRDLLKTISVEKWLQEKHTLLNVWSGKSIKQMKNICTVQHQQWAAKFCEILILQLKSGWSSLAFMVNWGPHK